MSAVEQQWHHLRRKEDEITAIPQTMRVFRSFSVVHPCPLWDDRGWLATLWREDATLSILC